MELVRRKRGSFVVELPLCILISMIIVGLPLVDLSMLLARQMFVADACSAAARSAATAPTFVTNDGNEPSAVIRAEDTAYHWCKGFSGITIQEVETSIAPQSLTPNGQPPQEYKTPIPVSDLDTNKYLYVYRVRLKADIEPFLKFTNDIFPDTPGLNKPVTVICVSQRVCEKPEGLIK